jgi:hypothetical protein
MRGSSRTLQIVAVGFGLGLAVLAAPVKVGAMDMTGMHNPMMTSTSPTSTVPVNVSAIESNVLARIAQIRMNLSGR